MGALSATGSGGAARGAIGPEGVYVPPGRPLAPAASPSQSVDGISCGAGEQLAFHIHAHLAIFVAGEPRVVPLGIGIAPPLTVQSTVQGPYASGGGCFSFLHTHASDGIVHIESPVVRTYTLGEFFDVWRQPLGRGRIGPASGRVTAFVNGRPYAGDLRAIPLLAHTQVQLDVGRPIVAPRPIVFPPTL